jgi:hypothetical protein
MLAFYNAKLPLRRNSHSASLAITARADKPTVIKDSEAIQYVGKEVAVYGQVGSVTTSPLRR